MTPMERLQTTLAGLGLKAVEARLETLLEQAVEEGAELCAISCDEVLGCEADARRTALSAGAVATGAPALS